MTLIMQQLRPALMMTLVLTVLLGLAYPLAMTGIAQAAFPHQANGSLLYDAGGTVIGSELIGQEFTSPGYFHGRPSVTVEPTAATTAVQRRQHDRLEPRADQPEADRHGRGAGEGVPRGERPGRRRRRAGRRGDGSGSGLDPHITPANAALQVNRVAQARGGCPADVTALVQQNTEGRTLGFLGEPRVNVLKLNLALDAKYGKQ